MGGYNNFYSNVCRLLGTLKRGVQHKSASVTLPVSKAGLDLARGLKALGIVNDVSVYQKAVRTGGRVWPAGRQPTTSTEAAGYPHMQMRLALAWARGGGANRYQPSEAAEALNLPVTVHGPTPETVTIISKPTHQRHVGLRELLAARAASPPGVFLLSTAEGGLMTDIEAELAGTGGVLLAHLGLPLAHVARLRGHLRARHLAAAGRSGSAGDSSTSSSGTLQHDGSSSSSSSSSAPPLPATGRRRRGRGGWLAGWDPAAAVARTVAPRLRDESVRTQAEAVAGELAAAEAAHARTVAQARAKLQRLALEEAAWAARGRSSGGGGDGGAAGSDGGDGSSGSGGKGSRSGGRRR